VLLRAGVDEALLDIAPLFEAANPGTKVQMNFGASDALLQQIIKGAIIIAAVALDIRKYLAKR